MINDERRVLADMENHLRMSDPAFVARMTVPEPRPARRTALFCAGCICMPWISLLFGVAGLAIATAALGVLVVIAFAHGRRRRSRMR
jgi:hypothetical protein